MSDTLPSARSAGPDPADGRSSAGLSGVGEWLSVERQFFAMVPEWVIDAEVSDSAFRVYAVLLRYGDSSGQRMPSRAALARRLRRSADSVDRALRELEGAGLVEVERRRAGRRNLTNRYHLRTSPPADVTKKQAPAAGAVDDAAGSGGGGRRAATPTRSVQVEAGRGGAGGRTAAAGDGRRDAWRVAAELRPDPEGSTHSKTSSSPVPSARPDGASVVEEDAGSKAGPRAAGNPAGGEVLDRCGITDLDGLTARVLDRRRRVGGATGRWAGHCLLAAIQLAVARGWPSDRVETALLEVAGDPQTRSPMRLAEAGPWWDAPVPAAPEASDDQVAVWEAELDALDGARVGLQRTARARLAERGMLVTRAAVLREAVTLWREHGT